jgi:hypothetical protein
MHRGEWALNLELGKKNARNIPATSSNVSRSNVRLPPNLTKKFAPEIEVPAQKNHNCALCFANYG